jgi:hypothetical protein
MIGADLGEEFSPNPAYRRDGHYGTWNSMAKFLKGKTGNPGGRPKGAFEARDLARKHTKAAIARLFEIMQRGTSEQAQVMATNSLLDRGWGKPIAVNEHGGTEGSPIVIKITGDSARL